MRKITVLSMMSLDGVIQGPGGAKEDASGGFKKGGWVSPYADDQFNEAVTKELSGKSDYLLGRKTFELWAGYWPQHGDFWPGINKGMKYVFSRKLKNSSPLVKGWKNSAALNNVAAIKKMKASKGPGIQVWGSSELVPLLIKNDLVDILRLKIYPLVLGKGKKLFGNGTVPAAFKLTDHVVTSKGVIIATYKRAGEVKTGDIVV